MSAKKFPSSLFKENDDILTRAVKHEELDVSPLPENTIPLMLPEAEEHYAYSIPPFLRLNVRECTPGTRRRVRLAVNGSRANSDIEADLILKAWKGNGVYWTLDLNSQRLIVRAFRGGAGGVFYRRWDGVETGFGEEAIAFAPLKQPGDASVGLAEESSPGLTSDGEYRQHRSVWWQSARDAKGKLVSSWGNRSSSSSSSSHGSSSPAMPNVETPRSAKPLHPRPTKMKPKSPSNLSPKVLIPWNLRQRLTDKHPELENPNTPPKSSPKRQKPSRDILKPTSRTEKVQKLSKRRRRQATDMSPELENFNLPSRSSARRQRFSKNSRNDVNQLNELHTPPAASTSVSFPIVSEERQNNTMIYVFFGSDTDSVPLKLRDMMTITTFFASVLEAFDLQGRDNEVRALRITFDSIPTHERESSWLMKKNIPATFERFLEVLNGLPVWEKEGKCSVEVRILMRD